MKIDKTNPSHWLCLTLFAVHVLGAMLLRLFRKRGQRKTVVLYGHKLCGNLLAIHKYWREHDSGAFDMLFLTMDKAYHRELLRQGVASVLATRPKAMMLLSRVDAVISDHGLHVMSCLVGRSDIKFFDVWHSVPFKGFDANDFHLQHKYTEIWVASPLVKDLYVEKYGFEEGRVEVTGYARTDRIVQNKEDINTIKKHFGIGLNGAKKVILFAPTWKQDSKARSIYPFGQAAEIFLSRLSAIAKCTGSEVIIRPHLNSGRLDTRNNYPGIVWLPSADWPDTEALLLVSDVLICDWSSIAFDWLLLDRPTIFLDVPIPFRKGFSLGPEYRYGAIVDDMDAMSSWLRTCVTKPKIYWNECLLQHDRVRYSVYEGYADGSSAKRYMKRLRFHMRGI